MAHDLAADLPEPPTPRLGYRRGAGCGSLKVEAAGDFRLISYPPLLLTQAFGVRATWEGAAAPPTDGFSLR